MKSHRIARVLNMINQDILLKDSRVLSDITAVTTGKRNMLKTITI